MKPERIEEIVANYYNTDIRLIKGQDQKAEYPEPDIMKIPHAWVFKHKTYALFLRKL